MRAPEPLPPAIAADLAAMDAAVAGRPPEGGDPVLAELAVLLRETRPLPDEPRARRIDSRAAAAFRAPARARRRPVWLMPALGSAAAIVLAVVIGVALHGSNNAVPMSGGSSGGGGSVSGASSESASPPTRAGGGSGAAASDQAGVPSNGSAVPGRAVERSTTMRIGTRPGRIDEVASGAARVATSLGGYVASSSVASGEGADLDLRVPGARLDQAVERLSQLGHVRRLERSTLDITDQLASARERVQESRAERRSLLAQLAAAKSRREAARIRARLAAVTRELRIARAEVRQLRTRANFASIAVTVVPERHRSAAAAGAWTPGDALHDAARVLEVAAGVALVALAVAIPLGLVGIPAWIAARRLARRRREHVLDLA